MKSSKLIDQKLDTAWSLLVKLRANNRCECCGTPHQLNSHHIHTRRNLSTRWDIINGMCLCVMHHTASRRFSAHSTPLHFRQWLIKYKGIDFVNELKVKSNAISKLMPFEKEELLKELNKEINSCRMQLKTVGWTGEAPAWAHIPNDEGSNPSSATNKS